MTTSLAYLRLKKHHIQQDTPKSCSLASVLMIVNCINGKHVTQTEFRDFLHSHNFVRWLKNTSKTGSGMPVHWLQVEVKRLFSIMNMPWSFKTVDSREISTDQLRTMLHDFNMGDKFIIFNYEQHYSPFGGLADDERLIILNVDATRIYKDSGDTLPSGLGDKYKQIDYFHKQLKRNKRRIVLIERVQ